MTYPESLVSPEWLHENRGDDSIVVVDCPWEQSSYARAHVPGALCRGGHAYVKGEDDSGNPKLHLPSFEEFQKLASDLGVGPETTVVAYDDWGTLFATRLWWVFRYYGHAQVKILDGGWQGWVSAGLPVSYETVPAREAPALTAQLQPDRLISVGELMEGHASLHVIDARSDDEYHGKAAHGNERVGHVPGALHLEWNRLLENSKDPQAVRRFRSPEEIQAILSATGIDPGAETVTYCQAAVRAAFVAFALELTGQGPVRVYDGSMAEWANRDDTPLE